MTRSCRCCKGLSNHFVSGVRNDVSAISRAWTWAWAREPGVVGPIREPDRQPGVGFAGGREVGRHEASFTRRDGASLSASLFPRLRHLFVDRRGCLGAEICCAEWYLAAAANGDLAITPEIDRAYRQSIRHLGVAAGADAWLLRPGGGTETLCGARLQCRRLCPVRDCAALGYSGPTTFGSASRPLQQRFVISPAVIDAIWTEGLPLHPLPAVCNWLCHLAVPALDRATGRFVVPYLPNGPIGILHLCGDLKDTLFDVRDGDGRIHSLSLRLCRTAGLAFCENSRCFGHS